MIVRVFVSLLIAVWAACGAARAEDDKVLNIYNWSDHIADDTVIRNDPNIYPPAEVRARLFFDKPVTPQYERLRTRAWTRAKTGS